MFREGAPIALIFLRKWRPHFMCTFKFPLHSPTAFFIEIDKWILKFTWKFKRSR